MDCKLYTLIFNPNVPFLNYIFCHHIGEIPIIHQKHYDSFPSVNIEEQIFKKTNVFISRSLERNICSAFTNVKEK